MNLVATLAAPETGALSLFLLGMALVLAGVRRKQAAELELGLASVAAPAESPRR